MGIPDEIILMVENAKPIPARVSEQSNLFTDLGFDSLAFIRFLVGIEDTYEISFGLAEMMLCLQMDRLIALVEGKISEREGNA